MPHNKKFPFPHVPGVELQELKMAKHMLTGQECLDCTSLAMVSVIQWITKVGIIWTKQPFKSPAVAGAVAFDLLVNLLLNWLSQEFIQNCIYKKVSDHIHVDKRVVVDGCRKRVKGTPKPLAGLFVPGGGRFGGAGAGASWGVPLEYTDPFGKVDQLPEWEFARANANASTFEGQILAGVPANIRNFL